MTDKEKKFQKENCNKCFMFQIGQCRGVKYNNAALNAPLCDKARKYLK